MNREEQPPGEREGEGHEFGQHQHDERGNNSVEQHVHHMEHCRILAPDRPLNTVERRRHRPPQSQRPAELIRPVGRDHSLR